jgi:hypothetical protein
MHLRLFLPRNSDEAIGALKIRDPAANDMVGSWTHLW